MPEHPESDPTASASGPEAEETTELPVAPAEQPAPSAGASTDSPGAPPSKARRHVSAVLVWRGVLALVLLSMVLAAVVGAFVGAGMIDVAGVCVPCHGAQVESLAKDSHKDLDCYDCHAGEDFAGRWSRVGRDTTAVFRLGRPVEASVPDDACEDCHGDLAKVTEARGLRMSHGTCLSSISRCTDCHADTAHALVAPARALDMGSCTGCHDGKTAPDTCETCHIGKREAPRRESNAWRVTHGANWQSTHGMGDLTTCRICHADDDCTRCHLGVPHRSDWHMTHGKETIKVGKDKCMVCHVVQLCDGCHGLHLPHPDGWLATHVTSTTPEQAASTGLCRSCHSETDCRECHEMHIHPGIPPEKLRELGVR